jgi:hypothetical protein
MRTGTTRTTRAWSDLSGRQKTALLVAASIQVSLAATAWTDLTLRKAEEVNGSKTRWAAIIAVTFVGPLSYFRWGRRNER